MCGNLISSLKQTCMAKLYGICIVSISKATLQKTIALFAQTKTRYPSYFNAFASINRIANKRNIIPIRVITLNYFPSICDCTSFQTLRQIFSFLLFFIFVEMRLQFSLIMHIHPSLWIINRCEDGHVGKAHR